MYVYQHILAQIRIDWERQRQQPVTQEILEIGYKFVAKMMLLDSDDLKIPYYEEWIGLNLLERDGELKNRK